MSNSVSNKNKDDGKVSERPSNVLTVAVGSTNPCKIDAVKHALQQVVNTNDSNLDIQLKGFSVESGVADQPYGDKETKLGAKNRSKNAYFAYQKAHGVFPDLAVGMEGGLEWSEDDNDDDDNNNNDNNHVEKQGNKQESNNSTDKEDRNNTNNNDSTLTNNNNSDKQQRQQKSKVLWCMAWISVYGRRKANTIDLMASSDCKSYVGDRKPMFNLSKTALFLIPTPITELITTQKNMELGHADDAVFGRTNSKHGSGTVGILTKGLILRSEYYTHAIILALIPWMRPDVYAFDKQNKQGIIKKSVLTKTTVSSKNDKQKRESNQDSGSNSLISTLFCGISDPPKNDDDDDDDNNNNNGNGDDNNNA